MFLSNGRARWNAAAPHSIQDTTVGRDWVVHQVARSTLDNLWNRLVSIVNETKKRFNQNGIGWMCLTREFVLRR